MANKCKITGKGTQFGGNRKHRRGSSGSGGVWRFKSQRTSRTWKPNLRQVKLVKDGKVSKETVAMNIYKKLRQGETINGYALASLEASNKSKAS